MIQQVESKDASNDKGSSQISELLASMAMMPSDAGLVSRFVTDGQGPSPKKKDTVANNVEWEWDGSVDDEAHFDLD